MDFTTSLKIAIKAGLIAVVTAAIIALFASIQIPAIDTSQISQALGTGLALMYHWVPIMTILWPIVLSLIAVDIALRGFSLAMIAIRWIFKVNE